MPKPITTAAEELAAEVTLALQSTGLLLALLASIEDQLRANTAERDTLFAARTRLQNVLASRDGGALWATRSMSTRRR